MLGVGLSEGTHLAAGTITVIGNLAGVAISRQSAVGTITFIGDVVAEKGVSFAFATTSFIGDLHSIGTNLDAELPPEGQALFEFATAFDPRNQKVIPVGAVTDPSLVIRAHAGIEISATLAGTSDSGVKFPTGTITAFGTADAQSGNIQVSGTITIIGNLIARSGPIITVTGSTTIFTDELPSYPSYVWLRSGTPPADTTSGSIGLSGSLSVGDDITQFAFGTIAFLGAVQADQVVRAFGTIAVSGNLAAVGTQAVVNVSGTITVIGSVESVSGNIQVSGTITVAADLTTLGTIASAIIEAAGSITIGATLFGTGHAFCPVTVSGSVVVTSGLAAREEPTDNIITAKGFITPFGGTEVLRFSGVADYDNDYLVTANDSPPLPLGDDFEDFILRNTTNGQQGWVLFTLEHAVFDRGINGHWREGDGFEILELVGAPTLSAKGTISGDGAGTFYAYGTIRIKGFISEAEIRKVSCIRPTGTILMSGATMSAFGGDLNQKSIEATITFSGGLGVSAIYARGSSLAISGSLTAYGRLKMDGSLAMLADPAVFAPTGQIGPGTIDGQKKAIIREAYGSIELYNNSQGGFYSIGGAQQLKEAFALINVTANLDANGKKDQTAFAKGTITV